MLQKRTTGEIVFNVFNVVIIAGLSVSCILPVIHVLALSFSSRAPAAAGYVIFWPVEFTTKSYEFIVENSEFFKALVVTLKRLAIGVPLNLLLTLLAAYPLSKEVKEFRWRTLYAWFFFITMLFGGGLIPFYMTVRATGLINTIWALVVPTAVPVFNVILLLNFFRGIPKEIEESAFIDGAGYLTVLFRIYVAIATPAMATIALFTIVGHWNEWFNGLIFMNTPEKYPLQSYLQVIIMQTSMSITQLTDPDSWKLLEIVSNKTAKAAQIFLGALPILLVYPFLQRYFVKGIVIGSVKG